MYAFLLNFICGSYEFKHYKYTHAYTNTKFRNSKIIYTHIFAPYVHVASQQLDIMHNLYPTSYLFLRIAQD